MNDDQFTKLFNYMEKRFDDMDTRFDETARKDDLEHLKNTMDDFIRRIIDSEDEQAACDVQWNRLLAWARKVSEKTGISLPDL